MSIYRPGEDPRAPGRGAPLLASELPDTRIRMIDNFRLPPAQNLMREVVALHAASGLQLPADPAVSDPGRQADLLIANEVRRLQSATLFWISPDMTALCQHAATTMPAFQPGPGDLPAPYGLMYFAAPIGGYDPFPRIILSGDSDATLVIAGAPVPVCAVSWGPWNQQGRWAGGGTWFTFFSPAAAGIREICERYGLRPEEAARVRMPPLAIDSELACPASGTPPLEGTLEEAVRDPHSRYSWMHLVLCACRMMAASRSVSVAAEPPSPRHVRKRSARAGVSSPGDPVRLVDIRARGSRRQPAREDTRRSSPQVRFPVRGHWRQQWYPRAGAHRPVYIEEFVKGPAGAPFRAGKTVYVFREPGERARRPRPDAGEELEP